MAKLYSNNHQILKAYLGSNEIDKGTRIGFFSKTGNIQDLYMQYLTFPPNTEFSQFNNGQLNNFINLRLYPNLLMLSFNNINAQGIRTMSHLVYPGYPTNYNSFSALYLTNINFTDLEDMSFLVSNYYLNLQFATFNGSSFPKVTNLDSMFAEQKNLRAEPLNMLMFNAQTWETTSSMFLQTKIRSILFPNMEITNLTNTARMFSGCTNLIDIGDVNNWNMSKVTNASAMFRQAYRLTNINVGNWDTSNFINVSEIFEGANGIQTVDVSNWVTTNVTDAQRMFDRAQNLSYVNVNNWDTSNITNSICMFSNCIKLENLNVSNWNTINLVNSYRMFYSCTNLRNLDMSNWDVSNLKDISVMFTWCKVNSFNLFDINNSAVTNMYFTFPNSDIANVDMSIPTVINCSSAFSSCNDLTTVSLNIPNATEVQYLFYNCRNLTDITDLCISNALNMENSFTNCNNLSQPSYNIIANALPNANQLTNQYLANQGLDPNKFDWDQILILNNKGYIDAIPDTYQIWYTTSD